MQKKLGNAYGLPLSYDGRIISVDGSSAVVEELKQLQDMGEAPIVMVPNSNLFYSTKSHNEEVSSNEQLSVAEDEQEYQPSNSKKKPNNTRRKISTEYVNKSTGMNPLVAQKINTETGYTETASNVAQLPDQLPENKKSNRELSDHGRVVDTTISEFVSQKNPDDEPHDTGNSEPPSRSNSANNDALAEFSQDAGKIPHYQKKHNVQSVQSFGRNMSGTRELAQTDAGRGFHEMRESVGVAYALITDFGSSQTAKQGGSRLNKNFNNDNILQFAPGGQEKQFANLNFKKKADVKKALKTYSSGFLQEGKVDYTRYSNHKLNDMLKKSNVAKAQAEAAKAAGKTVNKDIRAQILSVKDEEAIQNIIGLKKQGERLKKSNKHRQSSKASGLFFIGSRLEGCDAVEGFRTVYSARNGVYAALTFATTAKNVAGKTSMMLGKGANVIASGASGLASGSLATAKQTYTDNKKMVDDIKTNLRKPKENIKQKVKDTKQALKTKMSESRLGKWKASKKKGIAKRAEDIKNKISDSTLGKVAGKIGDVIGKAFKIVVSPLEFIASILTSVLDFFKLIGGYIYTFLGFVFIGIFLLSSFLQAVEGTFVYPTAAAIDIQGNDVEIENSVFMNTYDELRLKDDSWFYNLENNQRTPMDTNETGYYNPNTKELHKLERWGVVGVEDKDEHGEKIMRGADLGYYVAYLDGDDREIGRFSNIKLCLSMAHAFVGASYEDDNLEIFHDFALGLWTMQRENIKYKVSDVYSCSVGCDTYHYYCNKKDAYNLNTTHPEKPNFVHLVNDTIAPQTSKGCTLRKYDGVEFNTGGYIDTKDGKIVKVGADGIIKEMSGRTHRYIIETTGGQTTEVAATTKPFKNSLCSCTNIEYCNHSKEVNCSHVTTIKCDGRCNQSTTAHHTSEVLRTQNQVYTNIQPIGGGACYAPKYIPKCNSVKQTQTVVVTTKNGKKIVPSHSYYEAPISCGTRTIEKVPFIGTIDGQRYTASDNATFFAYVCHCNSKCYCDGHTTKNCNGHTVCAGYVKCSGHERCDGHDAKICLGHRNMDVDATILTDTGEDTLEANSKSLQYNGRTYEEMVKMVDFTGWSNDAKIIMESLYSLDWYEEFGISTYNIQGAPLSAAEIQAVKDKYKLEDDSWLSKERQAICDLALRSVGRIPYYWGGNAGHKGLDDRNLFGSPTDVAIDSEGQKYTLKGLDCTGFVGWLYWSCCDEKDIVEDIRWDHHDLDNRINKTWDTALPGDLVTMSGHVGIFISWADEAKTRMIVIDETPSNVTIHKSSDIQGSPSYWIYGPQTWFLNDTSKPKPNDDEISNAEN